MRAMLRAWRRRHLRQRVELQRKILGGLPMTGIDVGAADGLQPHWWAYEGAVDMYLFEPHAESARKLEAIYADSPYRSMFHVLPIGLARETGSRAFYMLNAPTGSSMYPLDSGSEFVGEDNPYFFPIRESTVEVRNLAEVLDEHRLERVDIAKLDVQGAELEILSGLDAARARQLTLVEAEVNLVGGITTTRSPYIGAPTWSELDAFMSAHGMRLLDISIARRHRPKRGDVDWYQREVFDVYTNSPGISAMVWEADTVYVRDYKSLIEASDTAGIRRLLVALGGYRYFSEAYFVVEQSEGAGLFTPEEAAQLKSALLAWHRLVARRPWHGRGMPWNLTRTLLMRSGLSQLRRWKQYMWFEYPNG
jgi:FkbM family methyltransferase